VIHALREANAILGFVTFFGLCFRLPQALAGVSSKRLYLALIAFPIGVAFGSAYALQHNFPPGPMAPYFTVAYLYLALVLVWWPKQLNPKD
jgi:hypothetical protein